MISGKGGKEKGNDGRGMGEGGGGVRDKVWKSNKINRHVF